MSGAGNITPLARGTGALQRSEGAARAGLACQEAATLQCSRQPRALQHVKGGTQTMAKKTAKGGKKKGGKKR